MLLLFQLLVGEGWHDVMYAACEIQGWSIATYYIAYVMIVTVLVTNLVFGVILDAFQKTLEDEEEETKAKEAEAANLTPSGRVLGLDRRSLRSRQLSKGKRARMGTSTASETTFGTAASMDFGAGKSEDFQSGGSSSAGASRGHKPKMSRTRSFGEEWIKEGKKMSGEVEGK